MFRIQKTFSKQEDHSRIHSEKHCRMIFEAPLCLSAPDLSAFFSKFNDVYMSRHSYESAAVACGGAIASTKGIFLMEM
jgi:hypothetical protein